MNRGHAWRDVLGTMIRDSKEKQRIANELGINPITLSRWTNEDSTPRPQNLQRLLQALGTPQRNELVPLLLEEFPEGAPLFLQEDRHDATSARIPPEFYERVLDAYTQAPDNQRFYTVSNLVLQQALGHLDPNSIGLSITIAQCVPPSTDGKIRSLREVAGRGTKPWEPVLQPEILFLGIESLAGFTVSRGYPFTINRGDTAQGMFPVQWVDWEQCAMAAPVMHKGCTAGCFLVASAQPDYLLPFRRQLVERYAQLLVLAFSPHEFYAQEDIMLFVMPAYNVQQAHPVHFRQRLAALMLEATQGGTPLSLMEAEQFVLKQCEEEFSRLNASEFNKPLSPTNFLER